ncbi:ribbon-helix-helix domain-containing protein [Microcoleus sp. Pol11C1]|uniref:ribbon-helix-helix domain-containing protein n=1 Tax=unclassified Microcoleus TaxID=2642155 RepID=UPI002FD568D7
MTRSSLTKMTCTISDELLAELDEACWQSRVNRSEFVRKALAIYLKNFHAQSNKISSSHKEALTA